jgi:protein disulfide isomerase family A protein 3
MPPPPPSEDLDDYEALEAFIDNEDCSIIGAFQSEDDDAFADFQGIAQSMAYDWRWAHTTDEEVLAKLKVKTSAVFLYRSPKYISDKYGDRKRERFPSTKLSESALRIWMTKHAQPLVGQYTYTTKDRYLAKKVPVVIIFFDINWEKNPKGTAYFVNRARKIGTQFKGQLNFAVASIKDFDYQLSDFGLAAEDKAHDVRIGLLHKEGNEELYYGSESEKFSSDILLKFATDYLAGSLEPAKRQDLSMPPPPMDEDGGDVDEGDVVVLTKDNFDEVVNDETKNVLVEFYAPWCGHCKSLKPEYAKAATALADAENIVLAKMDATAHDPPEGFDVQGYPTILFVKAESGAKPEPYEGEREADAMVAWLKSNAK